MAANLNALGILKKAEGFGAYLKSNKNGVITTKAKDGAETHLLAKGWQQDEKTGEITKASGILNKMKRNPVKSGLIIGGAGMGLTYGYNAYTGGGSYPSGGDSFTPSGEQ
jgi:hypothetical protein